MHYERSSGAEESYKYLGEGPTSLNWQRALYPSSHLVSLRKSIPAFSFIRTSQYGHILFPLYHQYGLWLLILRKGMLMWLGLQLL